MTHLIRDAWDGTADVFLSIAEGVLDVTVTLYDAIAALPLPFAVMAAAGGVALFHAIDQRAQRRDQAE